MTDPVALDAEFAEVKRLQGEAGLLDIQTTRPAAAMRAKSDEARRRFFPQVGLPVASITERTIPGEAGVIRIRIVRPRDADGTVPTVVFFHGGGWVFGGLDSHEGHTRRIANRVGAVVVSVDYRLAPEHPFPAGHTDALWAVRWAAENITEVGGDLSRLALAGDSAGGNLALAASLAAREQAIPIAAQLLLYPVTDARGHLDDVVTEYYLGPQAAELAADPRVSPVLHPRLAEVPPIVLGVGAHDFLYEENLEFARVVQDLGGSIELVTYPSLAHGFAGHASVSQACRAATDELCGKFGRLLGLP